MTTPYDVYQSMLNKQAVDALIPGQVGMGINSGHQDSDAAEATQSALARNRADMQAMALISGSADAGASYSTPPPATSPSLQMQADVKAAAVVDEAIKFAEYVYVQTKEAAGAKDMAHWAEAMAPSVGGRLREIGSGLHGLAWGDCGMVGKGVSVAGGLATAGGAGYAAMHGGEANPTPVSQEELKVAHAVLESLGLQAMPKQAGLVGDAKDLAMRSGGEYINRAVHEHPYRTAAMAAGAASAAAGTAGAMGGMAAGTWTGHQAAAAEQAMRGAVAQEQNMATPGDAQLQAMKAASLNRAAQAGQAFALKQLGLA